MALLCGSSSEGADLVVRPLQGRVNRWAHYPWASGTKGVPLPTATQFKPLRGSEPLPGLPHPRCPAADMGKDQPFWGEGDRRRRSGEGVNASNDQGEAVASVLNDEAGRAPGPMCRSVRLIREPVEPPSSTPQTHGRGAYTIFVSDGPILVKPYLACIWIAGPLKGSPARLAVASTLVTPPLGIQSASDHSCSRCRRGGRVACWPESSSRLYCKEQRDRPHSRLGNESGSCRVDTRQTPHRAAF